MPELSEKLLRLRPVTFHYKIDPKGTRQYGLIAEEVDKVYPELVIRDGSGKIQGVHYEELAPMLLKEAQQQRVELHRQQVTINTQDRREDADAIKFESQAAEIIKLRQELAIQADQLRNTQRQLAELQDLKRDFHAALLKLRSQSHLIAQR